VGYREKAQAVKRRCRSLERQIATTSSKSDHRYPTIGRRPQSTQPFPSRDIKLIQTLACINLIACHGASGDHFAVFTEKLLRESYEVRIFASEHAAKKFQDRKIEIFQTFIAENLSEEEADKLALEIVKNCIGSVALTDVGNRFDLTLQKKLAEETPDILRLAYYDNPEPYVPGGHSEVALEVMKAAQRVFFANANLENEKSPLLDVPMEKRIGLGYYPTAQAEKVAKRRAEESKIKREKSSLKSITSSIKSSGYLSISVEIMMSIFPRLILLFSVFLKKGIFQIVFLSCSNIQMLKAKTLMGLSLRNG
jgi:hypothetical protein